MAITASWVRDRDKFPWFLRARGGVYEGQRSYVVNTDHVEKALKAPGLPARGEPWSADFPNLTAQDFDWEHLGGADATGDGDGGWSRVTVRYAEPQQSGDFRLASLNKAFTEISVSSQTVLRRDTLERFAMDASGERPDPTRSIDSDVLINGGQGTPVQVGVWTARVTMWRTIDFAFDFARSVELSTPAHLNAAAVRLPPIYGTATSITMPRGSLLYLGVDQPRVEQGFLAITHTMQMARHWLYVWMRENAKGEAIQPLIGDRVYEYASFSGLWPE